MTSRGPDVNYAPSSQLVYVSSVHNTGTVGLRCTRYRGSNDVMSRDRIIKDKRLCALPGRHATTEWGAKQATVAMADLSERERVWKKIEEKEAGLGEKDKELKAVQTELKEELEKAQPRDNLLAYLERREAILSKQWDSLDAERQKFQDLLAAGGMCVFVSAMPSIVPPAEVPRHPRGWGYAPLR